MRGIRALTRVTTFAIAMVARSAFAQSDETTIPPPVGPAPGEEAPRPPPPPPIQPAPLPQPPPQPAPLPQVQPAPLPQTPPPSQPAPLPQTPSPSQAAPLPQTPPPSQAAPPSQAPPSPPAPSTQTSAPTATPAHDTSPPKPVPLVDDYGPLGPIRFGPIVGAGVLAHPIDFEAFLKIYKLVGIGFEYAFLPKVTISDVDVTAYSLGADLRLFASSGPFFLGAGIGYQSATGTNDAIGQATVSSVYLTPRLGWLWVYDFGLTFGVDLGVTIPLSSTTTINTQVPQELVQDEIDRATTYAKTPLPDIKLRLGYLF